MRVGKPVVVIKPWAHGVGPKVGDKGVVIGRHWKYRRVRFDNGDVFTLPVGCLEEI